MAPYASPSEFTILTPDTARFAAPVVSPDGRELLVMAGNVGGPAYLLDLASGERSPVLTQSRHDPSSRVPLAINADYAHWSSDSRWVVYTVTEGIAGGSRAVHRYDFGSQLERLSHRTYQPLAVISPDTLLVWGRETPESTDYAYLMGSEFDWTQRVGNEYLDARHPLQASWNPTDRRIAYSYLENKRTKIAVTDVAGSFNTDYDLSSRDAWKPVWGPPGRLLYVEGDWVDVDIPRGLWEVNLENGSFYPLLRAIDIAGSVGVILGSFSCDARD